MMAMRTMDSPKLQGVEERFKKVIRHGSVNVVAIPDSFNQTNRFYLCIDYNSAGCQVEFNPGSIHDDEYLQYIATVAVKRLAEAYFLGRSG